MCGIMGYIGPQQAASILVEGLRKLEYRGYDSAGIAIGDNGSIVVRKAEGKIEQLASLVDAEPVAGSIGIGHTRWATHGVPSDRNAHPHTDESGRFVVVHNGIIENFQSLREELVVAGHTFTSETDTEILAHLVAAEYDGDLVEATRRAVARAHGAYAIVVMTSLEPGRIVAVRMISPMVIGIGEGENFIASDITALLSHTRNMILVEDGEMVVVTSDAVTLQKLDGQPVERELMHVEWDAELAEMGGYPHFMLKEIFEQPAVITETLAGRLDEDGTSWLEGVDIDDAAARAIKQVWLTACGTAYNAALVAGELLERIVRIPTQVRHAHELRYSDPLIGAGDLAIAISQSGETADTLAAAKLARELDARLLAITNVVGSTLARAADDVLYTRAGPEIAVASTKAYMGMLVADYLVALKLGRARETIDEDAARRIARALTLLPLHVEQALKTDTAVATVAEAIVGASDVYFIGRGLDYAVAVEGSLKLKEISYLHSEAMPAGELKHGTLALVTEGTPVITVLTQSHLYAKTISAVQEVKARGGRITAVAYDDDTEIDKYADDVLRIPRNDDLVAPVTAIVPLQLLAYHVARLRGHDIDMPRNLAKSVTVE